MEDSREYPYYAAKWDKKNSALINFTKFNNRQDEEMNEFLLRASAVRDESATHMFVYYNTIKECLDGSEPASLTFSDEHVKDMMECACRGFGIVHPLDSPVAKGDGKEFTEWKAKRMEQAEALTILGIHKDFESEEKIALDIFVTQRGSPSRTIAAMIISSLLGGGGLSEGISVEMGAPIRARLAEPHQMWDPILFVQNKSAVKVSSEDDMLDAVKNILGENS